MIGGHYKSLQCKNNRHLSRSLQLRKFITIKKKKKKKKYYPPSPAMTIKNKSLQLKKKNKKKIAL